MIKKYRKLPVVVDAIKLTEQNHKDVINFVGDDIFVKIVYVFPDGNYFDDYRLLCAPCGEPKVKAPKIGLIIKTLEGELLANQGCYIVKDIKGNFYPCDPDIFEATYEVYDENPLEETVAWEPILDEYENHLKKRPWVVGTLRVRKPSNY